MSSVPKNRLTESEYLAMERQAEFKSEFYRGEMFAMTGASRPHNLIVGNAIASLHQQLLDRDCEVYPSDMRVKVSSCGLYTYPDVSVACQQPRFEDGEFDTLLNPVCIAEVLSKSTESYDRGAKFEMYRQLPSLQAYLLIAQDRIHVELFQRQSSEHWLLTEFNDPSDVISLDALNVNLGVASLYLKVDFSAEG
ncbi:MAG: Uma2 family endonuclease [Pirellulaceae bacterium]